MKMKKSRFGIPVRFAALAAVLLFAVSAVSCSKPQNLPVVYGTGDVTGDGTDAGVKETSELQKMVCVDWTDFVSHGGQIYYGDWGETTVSIFRIGKKLGEVTFNPPSSFTGKEWEKWNQSEGSRAEGCAFMRKPGTPFYAVKGDATAIAVRDGGKYYLYRLSGQLLTGYRDVRIGWSESIEDNRAVIIRTPAELANFILGQSVSPDGDGLDTEDAKTLLSEYDADFFASHMLAVVTLTSGSGSERFYVSGAELSEGILTVQIGSDMPEVGTCDMAAWLLFAELQRTDAEIKSVKVTVLEDQLDEAE